MSRVLKAFLAHERALKAFLSRFARTRQEVDDLAQETFLRAFVAEAAQPVAAPKAFLFRVARNLALNERARAEHALVVRMGDSAISTVIEDDSQPSVEDVVDARRQMALFAEAIASLPPHCRKVFVLRKIHGLTHGEIAEMLGISVRTVEKHVAEGLRKCAQYLHLRGYDAGVAAPSRDNLKSARRKT
jgi:RNA polymerase sigma-70 factor (ECF subfamily)